MATTFAYYEHTMAAGEILRVERAGTVFRCTKSDAPFSIRPDSLSITKNVEAGLGFTFDTLFRNVEVINGATAQIVGFYVGEGDIDDNRFIGSGGIRLKGNQYSNYGAVTVGVAATLVKAANVNRSTMLVQNLSSENLFIGDDASVTVANGVMINVGGSANFTFQETVYAISPSGAADVRFLEETL